MNRAIRYQRVFSSEVNRSFPAHGTASATIAANMASLRRIRSLVTCDDARGRVGRGGGGGIGGRRESSQPDPAAVFSGVRALLEHNLGHQPGSEEVRLYSNLPSLEIHQND